jgi:predicted metallopeptidase
LRERETALSHDHGKAKEKYLENGALEILAKEVIEEVEAIDQPIDAGIFQWKILFTNTNLGDEEIAGKCKKIDGAIRYIYGIDFLILIQKETWDAASPLEKTRILVHELTHIAQGEKGDPQIRKHAGDFCSIPEHDKQSYKIAEAIYRKLPRLKEFETQQEIAPQILA